MTKRHTEDTRRVRRSTRREAIARKRAWLA